MTNTRRTCRLEYCDRPMSCKELCSSHYYQQHRGKPLTPIGAKRANYLASQFDDQGRKQCAACREYLDLRLFGPSEHKPDKLRSSCNPCRREQYKRKAPTSETRYRRYGLTLSQFEDMLSKQGGRCAICSTSTPGGVGWVVDHDHNCCGFNGRKTCGNCNRGILCSNCNLGLGQFGDDADRIRLALAYLTSASVVRGV